ncbi:MAG: PP2C family protein-serine/threonine phosphatase [Planctomycetota bacterium]|nr:SpoIIE family protein phosphatase [Planctomycetaceae bacterium]MDQ3331816.1 PP2C family protein-serine/threonine phosphatase [Planctomycetota bacterium]
MAEALSSLAPPHTSTDDSFRITSDFSLSWQDRLDRVIKTMREMSLQDDPQEMVRAYARRMESLLPVDRRVSLSRRDLSQPSYRVTRFSEWKEDINPWQEKHRLPLHEGGLFADLIYADEPVIIDDLHIDSDDPAARYLDGQRSLMAIPMFDGGVALNMVILTRSEPDAFDRERFPDTVWISNLFGRATHNLVLTGQLRDAYEIVDRELKVVADIQQSLLPKEMPKIGTLDLAAAYRTSHRAGGDYYDFFPLRNGGWGILIADVSGHGTPAAVVMAITHSIAHLYPDSSIDPGKMLEFVNRHLVARYTGELGAFVTAFYGVYDPVKRTLNYSSAGHNPPRLRRCGRTDVLALDGARNIPLGLLPDVNYPNVTEQLQPGDRIVFYTDGITEAQNLVGELFGAKRLDHLLESGCGEHPQEIVSNIMASVEGFSEGAAATDDRTVIVANVL